MPPTLLIFIRGPGGSHPLKEGCRARLGTLCPSGVISSAHSPLGPRRPTGHGGAGWALRNGRALVSEDLPAAEGSQHRQAGTCLQREKHEIHRAGQRCWISRKGV
ncbi:unnamed protein product [Rangifer tarandus platyrhynchus]|uniref:Uncharacterized protein n=1 Tax=Rangifer tarandus platyrhynchus TaxID=3082113 RepID=A0AC59Y1S3_RANTA